MAKEPVEMPKGLLLTDAQVADLKDVLDAIRLGNAVDQVKVTALSALLPQGE